MTRETIFMVANVSSKWRFFQFHTHPQDFSMNCMQIWPQNWIFVNGLDDLQRPQKNFYTDFVHQMCVCKLAWDHINLWKQTTWSYDALNDWYGPKRTQMVFFEIWYRIQARICFPILWATTCFGVVFQLQTAVENFLDIIWPWNTVSM